MTLPPRTRAGRQALRRFRRGDFVGHDVADRMGTADHPTAWQPTSRDPGGRWGADTRGWLIGLLACLASAACVIVGIWLGILALLHGWWP